MVWNFVLDNSTPKGLILVVLMDLVILHNKFQHPTMPRSGLKVPGGCVESRLSVQLRPNLNNTGIQKYKNISVRYLGAEIFTKQNAVHIHTVS